MRLIDADDLMCRLYELHENACGSLKRAYSAVIDEVRASPTTDERHAVWSGSADGYADGELIYDTWECSNCGKIMETEDAETLPKYCPGCGCLMEVALPYEDDRR